MGSQPFVNLWIPFGVRQRAPASQGVDRAQLMQLIRDACSDFAVPDGADASHRNLFNGLANLEADLLQHIRLENDVLFPGATAAVALKEYLLNLEAHLRE